MSVDDWFEYAVNTERPR